MLLWDVLFRGQLGVSLTFIEEMYSRNLGNLFVSPLRFYELIAGQLAMSVMRTLIGVGGACLFAWLLFRYSIFSMGLPLIAFFACLLAFGWAVGLAVSAMILRYGLGAEELAWAAIFLVAPVSGVYYPIAVLPPALQRGQLRAADGARVRGDARACCSSRRFATTSFATRVLLDVAYVALGVALFAAAVHSARKRGTLAADGGEIGSGYSMISAAVTLRPSATRMLYVRHAARVSITSTPTCARCSGARDRADGGSAASHRCRARRSRATFASSRSKSASVSASKPSRRESGCDRSAVSTMLSRYSSAPTRTQPGPRPGHDVGRGVSAGETS